jgi:hypothetical protein
LTADRAKTRIDTSIRAAANAASTPTVAVVRFGVARGLVATIDVVADPKRLEGIVPGLPQ